MNISSYCALRLLPYKLSFTYIMGSNMRCYVIFLKYMKPYYVCLLLVLITLGFSYDMTFALDILM